MKTFSTHVFLYFPHFYILICCIPVFLNSYLLYSCISVFLYTDELSSNIFVLSWLSSVTIVEEGTRKEPNIDWHHNFLFFFTLFFASFFKQSLLLTFSFQTSSQICWLYMVCFPLFI